MKSKQLCATCSIQVRPNPRYSRLVCRDCAKKMVAANGRPVEFFNRDLGGGFVGRYADTRRPYRSHECFIDGVRCYADEARYGGIVIQVVPMRRSGRLRTVR